MNAVNLRNISFLKSNWTSHLQTVSGLNCKETQISLEIWGPCGIANASHSHKTQFCSFHTRTGTGLLLPHSIAIWIYPITIISGDDANQPCIRDIGILRAALFSYSLQMQKYKLQFLKEAKAFEFCCHNHHISTVYTKSLLLKSIYIVAFTVWTHSLLNCNHNARTLVHIPRRPIVVVVNFRFHPTIPDRFAFRYRPENMPKYAERL